MSRHMARHAAHHAARHAARRAAGPAAARRGLLRAGLVLSAAGVALGAGAAGPAGAAEAAGAGAVLPVDDPDVNAAGQALTGSLKAALGPVTALRLNPLAGTGSDPTDNAVGTQLADFPAVSTALATAPLSRGAAIADLPLLGPLTQGLRA